MSGLIYHYTGISTLISIATNWELWLSDPRTMNDHSEFIWGRALFEGAMDSQRDRMGDEAYLRLLEAVQRAEMTMLPLICCFSRSGDRLSQWRAYADDGRGVAIGFDSSKLDRLPTTLREVKYDEDASHNWMVELISKSKIERFGGTINAELDRLAENFVNHFVECKHPTFEEEEEVRLVRQINIDRHGEQVRLRDPGGRCAREIQHEGLPIQYRERLGRIISYIRLPFGPVEGEQSPIREVRLGPKTQLHNDAYELRSLLAQNGHEDVQVNRSYSPYR